MTTFIVSRQTFSIGLLVQAEIPQARSLIAQNFSAEDAENATAYMQRMFTDAFWPPRFYVARTEGQVMAVVCLATDTLDENVQALTWLAVAASLQGQGVGKAFLQRVCAAEGQHTGGCDILLSALPALAGFYTAAGFTKYGPLRDGDLYRLEIRGV